MTGKREKPAKVVPLTVRKCPTCGKPMAAEFRPFCSKRCADVDLGRWLNEEYRIPTDEAPTDAFADEPGDGPNDGPDGGEGG